jgi:hypothetical protein
LEAYEATSDLSIRARYDGTISGSGNTHAASISSNVKV